MDNTKQYRDQQETKQLQNRISSFMKDFKVGTPLHSNGIRKLRGVSPFALFTAIFSLPFADHFFLGDRREVVPESGQYAKCIFC
jgi:hypothetical protein